MNEEEEESTIYQNKISDAIWLAEEQMRMASERTYLSWIRTGLTSVGLGVAIAKLLMFRAPFSKSAGQLAGALLILWGLGVFLFALFSYRKNYERLRIYKFSVRPLRALFVITAILIFITLALFLVIFD